MVREALFRCSNCGHALYSTRAAENVENYGCPVCSNREIEAVPNLAEVTALLSPYHVAQLSAHIARRGAKRGEA